MLNQQIFAFMAKNLFLDDKTNWINHALISMPAKSIGTIYYLLHFKAWLSNPGTTKDAFQLF